MAQVLQFRPPRRDWRHARRRRWLPRASTVRLVVLLAIAGGLYVKDGLLSDPPPGGSNLHYPTVSVSSFSGRDAFTLRKHGYRDNCVIDADTIRYHGVKIRLADIDTPETYESRCSSELALGQRATDRFLELINAGPFEVVATGGRDTDSYGRKLRLIERDGHSLGAILVSEKLARRCDGARRSWCG
jgi:micrococcal nuclease